MRNWEAIWSNTYLHIDHLGYFPGLDEKTDEDADLHHKVGLVVHDVQEHDQGLEDTKEHWADGEALQRLAVIPELDIYNERGMKARSGSVCNISQFFHKGGQQVQSFHQPRGQ